MEMCHKLFHLWHIPQSVALSVAQNHVTLLYRYLETTVWRFQDERFQVSFIIYMP